LYEYDTIAGCRRADHGIEEGRTYAEDAAVSMPVALYATIDPQRRPPLAAISAVIIRAPSEATWARHFWTEQEKTRACRPSGDVAPYGDDLLVAMDIPIDLCATFGPDAIDLCASTVVIQHVSRSP
jgi:hypothetical protein